MDAADEGVVLDNPCVIFQKKLQLLKSNLRKWNNNSRHMVATKKKNIQDSIESIDSRLMSDDGSATLREQRVSLLKELVDLDHSSQLDIFQ